MNTLDKITTLIKSEYVPIRFQRSNRTSNNPFVPILTKEMDFAFDKMGELFDKEDNENLLIFYKGLIDSIFELETSSPQEKNVLKKKIDLFLKQIGRELQSNKELRRDFGDKVANPLLKKL